MLNRQKSSKIGFALIALVLITNFTFASTPNKFEWLGFAAPLAENAASRKNYESLSPQTVVLSDDFEGATTFLFANGTSVNDWVIGGATNNGGTMGAYVSNNGGGANAYTNTATENASHLYAPISIPAGETAIILSFDWKGVGEHSTSNNTGNGTSWDFMRVSVTTAAPVGGTMTATADQLPVIFNAGANYNRAYVVLPSTLAGAGARNLVFTWRNDSSGGTTAGAIDNVTITSQTPSPLSGTKTIPGNYPSIGAAIADVSANGADTTAGNLTFDIAAGSTFNETPPVLTASGSTTGRIVFQKSGVGANPKIVATGSGNFGATSLTTVTSSSDGIIILNGSDYVTFDGIDLEGGALVGTTATTTAQEYGYLIRNASATNGAQNNIVQNTSVTLHRINTLSIGILQSAASALGGGVAPTASTGANNNNKYYNLSLQNMYNGINLLGTAGFPDDLNEIGVTGSVTKNTIGGAGANDIGNGSSQTSGIRAFAQSNVKIFSNEIRNVTGTSTSSVEGIYLENTGGSAVSVGTSEIYKNVIHDIRSTSTSTTSHVVSGIRAQLSGNAASISRVYNNFVYDLNNASTNTTSRQLIGIRVQDAGSGAGSTHNIVNNSVRLAPTSIGCSNSTFEIGTTSGPIMNVQNNIFANFTGAQTTVKHYTWASTSATLVGAAGSVSNNNDLYIANTTNGFVGVGSTTDRVALSDWQTATVQDGASISSDPLFAGTTDLHITGTSPAINTGATIAFITNDIDMETRPNGANYDIGADEFYPQPGVLQLSSTTYGGSEGGTANATVNRVSGSSGTVGVTYTLNDGTATGGAACGAGVDYVNPGPQPLSFGDTVTSQPIVVTLCTDALIDVGETFTITLSSPTGGATLGSPIMATVTITDVAPPFNGSYNVGTAQTFTSLTNPGGIFESINTSGATGNITINITSDLTGETGAVALNQIAGGFTVLIKPSGAARTITSTTTAIGLITLNAADNVTIDGSLSGGTDRSLTLINANTTTSGTTVVGLFSAGIGAGATDNTIKNTIIQNGTKFESSTSSFNFGIYAGSGASATSADIDNLTIENNLIQRCYYGIQAVGFTGGELNNLVINRNTIGGAVLADYIGRFGILVGNANVGIDRNTVRNHLFTAAADGFGILLGSGVTNSSVTRNTVNNLEASNSGGYGMTGIGIATGNAASNVTVSNNMVYDIKGWSWTTAVLADTVVGIRVSGTNTGGINIWHNSVNLYATYPGSTNATVTAAFMVTATTPTNLDVRNNIFANTFDNTAGSGDKSYAIYTTSANTMFSSINYNDYYVSGAAPGVLGAINSSDATTLGALQTATGQDANSISADPLYTSTTDLHLQTTPSLSPAIGAGIFIGAVTLDFDGDPRIASSMPDIGADEVVQSVGGSFPPGTFYNAILGGGDMLGGNVTITNNLTLTGISDTGANTLTLGCDATVTGAGATNYIVGTVSKQFCAPTMFTFPVGTTPNGSLVGEEFSPFTANVTAVNVVPSALTVFVVDNFLAGSSMTQSASRYWDVTETGDITADISFTYLDISAGYDVNGTETGYNVLRRSGGVTAVYPGGAVNDATNTGSATGVTNFSQWAAGNLAPLAAGVSIGGRVMTTQGQGIPNARLVLTDALGNTRQVQTNGFGYYNFDEVDAGQTVTVSVAHKQFIFGSPTLIINVGDSVTDADFIASGANELLNSGQTYFDRAPLDFDGDGRTDISVFRAADSTWLINQSSNNRWTRQAFGLPTDSLAPADYDGDGRTDYAVFRRSEETWYIWNSSTNDLRIEKFGGNGDIPCPADINGDGRADLIVWSAAEQTWKVLQSSDGRTVEIGADTADKTAVPLVGDFDTDGKADLTIYVKSSGTWRILLSSTGETSVVKFGTRGSAAMGDFDGDARADLAVYSEGVWQIRNSRTGEIVRVGMNAGDAASGDFDGDGRLDTAVFNGGRWSVRQSASGFMSNREFGLPGDIGLPTIFVR